ncbi:MAG: helix-turn-helix domain-containing protein, partial [Gemmatimonadota bacterium]
MSTRESPPRRKDAIATRARLIRAALDLFTSIGYERTTTLTIAARAGIAEATIYRHFTGKDALFNEAIREANRWGLAALRHDERDRTIGVRERLTRIARRLLDEAAGDPALPTLLLQKIQP